MLVDPQKSGVDPSFVMRSQLAKALADAGAAAMLIPSDKPGRMVYTSAFGFYPRAPLPVVSVAKEDAALLRRLVTKSPVRLTLDVKNTFENSPYRERNVIADLTGREPGAVVLIGAHYDSWDVAQGADDDGSGVAAVLEAARILKSLGVTPRRTIRFAFFSGEEEATLGSRAYVVTHEKELDALRAVLITDSAPGTPWASSFTAARTWSRRRRSCSPRSRASVRPRRRWRLWFDRDHGPFHGRRRPGRDALGRTGDVRRPPPHRH